MTAGRTRPPGTSWRIVPLGPACLEDLTAFFAAFESSGSGNFFHPHPLDRAEAERLCARQGKDHYCLAYVDEAVAGYGMLRGWDEGYAEPSLGVALLPGFRGLGLGRKLTEHLHAEAARRGAASVRLKVYSSNRVARDLYAKLGYVFAPHADGVELGRLDEASRRKMVRGRPQVLAEREDVDAGRIAAWRESAARRRWSRDRDSRDDRRRQDRSFGQLGRSDCLRCGLRLLNAA